VLLRNTGTVECKNVAATFMNVVATFNLQTTNETMFAPKKINI
jgi:hypothetical protein